MPDNAEPKLGRKVIFLHPHSVVAGELVQELVHREFEVYLVDDHVRLRPVLARPEFRNALLFVNIDEVLGALEWQSYVRGLRESATTGEVHIGILSYNDDDALASKYVMDIGVQAGFVRLKLGLAESTRIILGTLAATEAKGQRKYVRADCTGIVSTSFNARIGQALSGGRILDVSSVGMACLFDRDPGLAAGASLRDIQLRLKGSLVMLAGTVAGTRQVNADRIYVLLFEQPHPSDVKEKLLRFIHECLQARLRGLLETGGKSPPSRLSSPRA